MSTEREAVEETGTVLGFDHIALPMHHTEAMIAFYRSLGFDVTEKPSVVQIHLGNQMINFHHPELWQGHFPLRAPEAKPPCGDMCFVWGGSTESLRTVLDLAGVEVLEGPVEREGARRTPALSSYVRDPDGNLLEFMSYL